MDEITTGQGRERKAMQSRRRHRSTIWWCVHTVSAHALPTSRIEIYISSFVVSYRLENNEDGKQKRIFFITLTRIYIPRRYYFLSNSIYYVNWPWLCCMSLRGPPTLFIIYDTLLFRFWELWPWRRSWRWHGDHHDIEKIRFSLFRLIDLVLCSSCSQWNRSVHTWYYDTLVR